MVILLVGRGADRYYHSVSFKYELKEQKKIEKLLKEETQNDGDY